MLKPGVVGSEVDATAHRVMGENGFGEYYWHRAAYSLGLGFPPHWGEPWVGNLGPGNDMVVEEGMAFHTTPSVHILGEFGIPVSESVIVTADGCEAVADVERRLFHT
jgi:Xaa-Pro dipeptidase